MTIASTINRTTYVGGPSPSVGPYPFTFYVQLASDLQVQTRTAALPPILTTLVLGVDYTVAGAGAAGGGAITLVTALATGVTLSIRLAPPVLQGTSLRNQGPYSAASVENTFDRGVQIALSQQDQMDRSLRFPTSYDPAVIQAELSPIIPNAFLRVSADGLSIGQTLVPPTPTSPFYPTQAGEVGVVNPLWPLGYVERYGAVPDGATDCYQAIMNAIASVGSSGTVTFGQRGVYVTSNTIVTTATVAHNTKFVIRGQGSNATFLYHTGGQANGCMLWNGAAVYQAGEYLNPGGIGGNTLQDISLGSTSGPALNMYFSSCFLIKDVQWICAGPTAALWLMQGCTQGRCWNVREVLGNETQAAGITFPGATTALNALAIVPGTYNDGVNGSHPGMSAELEFYACRTDSSYTGIGIDIQGNGPDGPGRVRLVKLFGGKYSGTVSDYSEDLLPVVRIDGATRVGFVGCVFEPGDRTITRTSILLDNQRGETMVEVLGCNNESGGYVNLGPAGGVSGGHLISLTMTDSDFTAIRAVYASDLGMIALRGNRFGLVPTTWGNVLNALAYSAHDNVVAGASGDDAASPLAVVPERLAMGATTGPVHSVSAFSAASANAPSYQVKRARGTPDSPSNISDADILWIQEVLARVGAAYVDGYIWTLDAPTASPLTTRLRLQLALAGTLQTMSLWDTHGQSILGALTMLTTVVAAVAPVASVYVDSVDGKLYFRDAGGTAHVLY